jgi:hypothetical protein
MSDEEVLSAAAQIRPERTGSPDRDDRRAAWLYFIGETLRKNGDRRAARYFREALRESPLHGKSWLRLIQALVT